MKKCWCAFMLGAAASLAAAVLDFRNFERDGKPVLIPAVHKYEAEGGVCKLPEKLTVAVPAGEELIAEQLGNDLKRFNIAVVADKEAFCRFVVTDKNVPDNDEGYTLTVENNGITVASRTAAGVFYGAQTLRNLLRNAATPELKCCRIDDWPDFVNRGYSLNLRDIPVTMMPEIKRTMDALASMRINRVIVGFGEAFPYKNNPFTKRRFTYPAEALREIVDYCHARHIEVVPSLQIWSHALWMTFHPDWEKMREGEPNKPWNNALCPLNEQAREVTRMAIEEQIEFLKPPMFSVAWDEICLCPFHVCPRCQKEDPKKLLADFLDFVRGILDKHGVKMLLCQDSFVTRSIWPYGDWYRTQLRKDAYINWWCYRDELPEEKMAVFKEFNLFGSALSGKPFNVWNMAHLIKKYGGNSCRITRWYYTQNALLGALKQETPDSLGGFVNGADYLWNLRETQYPVLGYDGTYELMRRMYPEKIAAPFPRTGTAAPVPLERMVNAELSDSGQFPRFDKDAQLDELQAALAKLPERFRLVTSPGGKYYALRLAGHKAGGRKSIQFPFGDRRARRLSFLLTCSRPWNMMEYHGYRYGAKRFKYDPAARVVVGYADGKKLVRELRYRRHLTDWNRPFGGTGMRFAVRGLDADKNYYSFGIYDFENPRPEEPIRSIAFSTAMLDRISPALLALSAWDADKPFALPKKAFDPAIVAKQVGVKPDAKFDSFRVAKDFKDGFQDVEFSGSEKLVSAMKTEVVDDPTSPSGGKVLKITIPPGHYHRREMDKGYLRLTVALPVYTVPEGTRVAMLDCRLVAAAGDFSHANDYFTGAGERGKRKYRMYPFRVGPEWSRIFSFTPATGEFTLKKLTDTRRRSLGFFFHDITAPVEIRIGQMGDSTENYSPTPLWKEGTEAEPI